MSNALQGQIGIVRIWDGEDFEPWADAGEVVDSIRDEWRERIGEGSLRAYGLYVGEQYAGRLCLSVDEAQRKVFIESLSTVPEIDESDALKTQLLGYATGGLLRWTAYHEVGTANLSKTDTELIGFYLEHGFMAPDGTDLNPAKIGGPSDLAVHLSRKI